MAIRINEKEILATSIGNFSIVRRDDKLMEPILYLDGKMQPRKGVSRDGRDIRIRLVDSKGRRLQRGGRAAFLALQGVSFVIPANYTDPNQAKNIIEFMAVAAQNIHLERGSREGNMNSFWRFYNVLADEPCDDEQNRFLDDIKSAAQNNKFALVIKKVKTAINSNLFSQVDVAEAQASVEGLTLD